MKTKFILLMCAVFSTTVSLAQTYFHFPDSNAVWSVYEEKYYVNGDTNYNSIDYKKYYHSNDSIINTATATLFSFVRQDTLAEKVFAVNLSNGQEHLIYDFSLNLNDTAVVYPLSFIFGFDSIRVKVDLIDSVLISGQYRKRFTISGVDQNTWITEYWIEGIGSTFGPFNGGITGVMTIDYFYPVLLCFEQDGLLLYDEPTINGCYYPSPNGINENNVEQLIHVYPNPFSSTISIKIEKQNFKNATITIHDVIGATVFQTSNLKPQTEVDLSILPKGIYLLEINLDGERLLKKIVKE